MAISGISFPSNHYYGVNDTHGWRDFFKYSPTPEEFIIGCWNVAINDFGYNACGNYSKTFTDVSTVVYTISPSTYKTHLYRHSVRRRSNLYYVVLNSTIVHTNDSKLFAFMKPMDVEIYDEEMYPIELTLSETRGTRYILSYSYTKSTLIKAPYDTNCFNYKTVGLDSQAHCFENCLLLVSIRNNMRHRTSITRTRNDQQPIKSTSMNYKCEGNDTKSIEQETKCYFELRKECNSFCRKRDCIKEFFDTKLDGVEYLLHDGFRRAIQLLVTPLNSLSVIITHIPRISPVDYITYTLSCLSFWLGLSPLSFMLHMNMRRLKHYFTMIFGKTAAQRTTNYYGDIYHLTMLKFNSYPAT